MALVTYSDSEDSDSERQAPTSKGVGLRSVPSLADGATFTVDKAQPNKIKVNLQQSLNTTINDDDEDGRAAKRLRTGAGAFSGFNSLLPAPKQDQQPALQNGSSKPAARKVFSLKTGTEAAFSRESDQELRTFLAEQNRTAGTESKPDVARPTALPKPAFTKPAPPASGPNPLQFKPLSVARNQKKKKPAVAIPQTTSYSDSNSLPTPVKTTTPDPPRKKVSLFSAGTASEPALPEPEDDPDPDDSHFTANEGEHFDADDTLQYQNQQYSNQAQSLDSIATDLNLSEAERRQLFGRTGRSSNPQAMNIVNFNTDAEYAANQQLIAHGETVQHNPVRGIAPGKHSLKQLLSAASGQKEALEESFAQGRRNKREAGNKYGW